MVRNSAPGIFSARMRPFSGGIRMSESPTMTSVGARISDIRSPMATGSATRIGASPEERASIDILWLIQ